MHRQIAGKGSFLVSSLRALSEFVDDKIYTSFESSGEKRCSRVVKLDAKGKIHWCEWMDNLINQEVLIAVLCSTVLSSECRETRV